MAGPMNRACDVCGDSYSAVRDSSRFCSDRCRKRAQRNPTAVTPGGTSDTFTVPAGTDVESSVMVELARYGKAGTPRGVVALALARRIDRGVDTGSSVAACSRELRAILDDMAGSMRPRDFVDDLIARREARMAEARRRTSVAPP